MNKADLLKQKYEEDLEELQESCPHFACPVEDIRNSKKLKKSLWEYLS